MVLEPLNRRVLRVRSIEKNTGLLDRTKEYFNISDNRCGVAAFITSSCTSLMNTVKKGDRLVYMMEGLYCVVRLEDLEGNILYSRDREL